MAKHWRMEDDEFLVEFFDAVGDYIGEHDLGRPKGAATRRVAHLKKTGAWDALCRRAQAEKWWNIAAFRAELEYARALGFDVPVASTSDEEVECSADLWDGDMPWRRKDPHDNTYPAYDSAELGRLIQETVAEYSDVDGVSWRHVAVEVAKELRFMLLDIIPATGMPRDLTRKAAETA